MGKCAGRSSAIPLLLVFGLLGGCAGLRQWAAVEDESGTRETLISGTWREESRRCEYTFGPDSTFTGPAILVDREFYHDKALPETAHVEAASFTLARFPGTYQIRGYYGTRHGYSKRRLKELLDTHGLSDFRRFYLLSLYTYVGETIYTIARSPAGNRIAVLKRYDSKYPFREMLLLDRVEYPQQ